jgi:hypothetical protein
MPLLREKIPSPTDADKVAIGASNDTWHANDPLPGVPTVVVPETGG